MDWTDFHGYDVHPQKADAKRLKGKLEIYQKSIFSSSFHGSFDIIP
jgi:hypothetical protein